MPAKKAKAKKKAPTRRKTAAAKAPAKESKTAKAVDPSDPAAAKAAEKPPAEGPSASSLDVNMSHVFALRPRVTTSFKPGDFSTAKHQLQDETYPDIQAAALAVVEKALELTHGVQKKSRQRRF